ncbi:leucine dehydrogenase [Schleiferia thermophila str. Yellowstone]|nr:leucine dehydrogenase [Schleiferia thermophila str. Yellowstone]
MYLTQKPTKTKTFMVEKVHPVVFSHDFFDGHEQVVFCHDEETGLKAIIGIHSTVLGPALGGTRMWPYESESAALWDVLRLSRGMTFKASLAGLNLGGGKAVIIADSRKDKTPEMMRAFGRFVNSLSGKYITAEDVGIKEDDIRYVKEETDFVTGIPTEMGGSGDPSPVTAYGVFVGIKAAARYKWGSEELKGRKVLVQGVGNVGLTLVKYLSEAGTEVWVQDVYPEKIREAEEKYNARAYTGHFADAEVDIYSPCALGATLNDETIPALKCAIVAGAANNQLADENRHSQMIQQRGILYCPDFLINAGGLINVYSEIAHYDRAEALRRTENIYHTLLDVITLSEKTGITTHQAAYLKAKERIENHKKIPV